MHRFVQFLSVVVLVLLLCIPSVYAQRCDDCGSISVLLYGVKVGFPPPPFDTLHTYYTGSANYNAFLHWVDLTGLTTSNVINTDPQKDCVEWLDGSIAEQRALQIRDIKVTVSQYGVDVPHAGEVKGGDYLLWGQFDSLGGGYRVQVFLEDATTRDRIAVGTKLFSDSRSAINAIDSALIQIEPLFETIRTYQKQIRNQGNSLAIHPRIKILPQKISIKSSDSTNVAIQVYDCDGPDHPLKNRWIKLKTSLGYLGADSVQTDDKGEAHVMFYSDLNGGTAKLEAAYFPYMRVTHKQAMAWADTLVDIDYVPSNRWQLQVNVTYSSTSTNHFENTGGSIDGQEAIKQSINGTLYGEGEFTDSSCVFKDALMGDVDGSISTQRAEEVFALLGDGASDLTIDKKNMYGHPLIGKFKVDLSGNKNQDGIYFYCSADNATEVDSRHFEHVESVQSVTEEHSRTDEYPNGGGSGSSISFPYLKTLEGTGTYTGTNGRYQFTGNYSVDTAFTDMLGGQVTHKETYHVQVVATPRTPVTAVGERSGSLVPQLFSLLQNYPNPFNPTTNLGFRISALALVKLKICNVLGQEVATLVKEVKPPGNYTVTWNAGNNPSGIYFYRLEVASVHDPANSFSQTRKMLLVK